MDYKRTPLLRQLWREKLHSEPRALDLSPKSVRDAFEHPWAPADYVLGWVALLPIGLQRFWASHANGHVVLTHLETHYDPAPYPRLTDTLQGVAYIRLGDLVTAPDRAAYAFLELFDHLLGSGCDPGDGHLSEGAGLTPSLAELGQRFVQLAGLDYAREELGVSEPRDYWTHTLWLYLQDRQRLSVLDPLAYRLYAFSLWDEALWDHVQEELAQFSGSATRS